MDAAARALLVLEAQELLSDMERSLLEMEAEGPSAERINAAFRAAHTIKGSAGLFGLGLIVSFCQVLESVLDKVRSGTLATDPDLTSMLLQCCDYIGRLVQAIESGTEQTDPDPTTRESLMQRLQRLLGVERASLAIRGAAGRAGLPPAPLKPWHVSLRFARGVLLRGMDPLAFIQYLAQLGSIVYMQTLFDDMPPAELMDPEQSYLGFELGLRTDADRSTLERVFDLVSEDSQVRLLAPESGVSEYIQLIRGMPQSKRKLGELLIASGALSASDLDGALHRQSLAPPTSVRPRLGELLIQEQLVAQPVVLAAVNKQQLEERRGGEQRVLKVDAGKLDQLINLVGELVIASESARLTAHGAQQPALLEAMGKVMQVVEQVRDRALDLRMTPIGEVFQRFPRVVRDVSRELGKQIELVVTGAEAELDKSMVDKLADPLLHIVRNAIDHGIETCEQRAAAGKRAQGRLHLHAFHESGCIVIEIRDDGRGLDRARILSKAIERGLISPDAELSDAEVHQLIFLPGFSTASQVTSLSGRGVGMDVVKRTVEQLRGEVQIDSRPGRGSRFRIRLPLTLAIIDGFQVAIGDTIFVIPLSTVVECADMTREQGMQNLLSLRGEPLPYLRLRDVFQLEPHRGARESLVVVRHGAARVGLVVDRLIGDAQAVIKPLGEMFRSIRFVSSSTILGDGTIALILDIPTLVARAGQVQSTGTAHALLH
ncbi:MAG: CheA signal transduction histidine kinase [Myxococcaceae bacterium]|nr:CheA signal transduction histidine kinase [Myxococcaceae bacterium]